jgi:hypothetical protein
VAKKSASNSIFSDLFLGEINFFWVNTGAAFLKVAPYTLSSMFIQYVEKERKNCDNLYEA